jgi:hypothetical protein
MPDENYVKPDQRAALRFPNFTVHFDSVPEAIKNWPDRRMGEADGPAWRQIKVPGKFAVCHRR